LAFPEIGQTGGTIVGRGKPGFPGGTRVPPTEVQICGALKGSHVTIEQMNKVDFCTIDPKSGDVMLTIVDHLPWDEGTQEEGEHLLALAREIEQISGTYRKR